MTHVSFKRELTDSDLMCANQKRYFLFMGPTPMAVLQQVGSLTGLPPLPPIWALGFKYHTLNSQPQSYIEDIGENFSLHGIPLAHVVIENYYQSGHELQNTSFPNPAAMVQRLGKLGTKVVLWLDPHVHRNGTVLGQALTDAGCMSSEWANTGGCGCSMKAGCGYSDLTSDKCIALWKAQVSQDLLPLGIAGFKLDQNDGGVVLFEDNTTFPPSGFTGSDLHNVYGFAFQKMFHEMYTDRGERTWLQSRGNYMGGQAYSSSSYSDGYSYDVYVNGLVNSGFTGLVWAPEVRYATCDADYARRVQLMLLGSQSQFNAWQHGDVPWTCVGWAWDMFVRHYRIRMQLGPYLYTAAHTQSTTGVPILRPLLLHYPADKMTRGITDQYFLGDALMVASIHLFLPRLSFIVPTCPVAGRNHRSVR